LDGLTADQDEDSCEQCQHTSDDADAKTGERDNPNRYEINREQKHADVFSNHVASIWNVPVRWQSKTRCADVSCKSQGELRLECLRSYSVLRYSIRSRFSSRESFVP